MEGVNYPSKTDDWKTYEKNDLTIALDIFLTKHKYIQLVSQKLIQIMKNNPVNDSKQRKRTIALSYSKKSVYIIKRNNIKT